MQIQCKYKLGDWVLFTYDSVNYPGEIVDIIDGQFKVKAMEPFGAYWRWPVKDDIGIYEDKDIVYTLSPPTVCGSRGQFSFIELDQQ